MYSPSSSAVLEIMIQSNYPGLNLPPLWQVIYQEAVRGHHLLFRKVDIDRFDRAINGIDVWINETLSDSLEEVAVTIVACNELQDMINIIDALAEAERRNLYIFYRRILWMWQNYAKNQLN